VIINTNPAVKTAAMDLFKQQNVEDFYEIGEELGRYRHACCMLHGLKC